MEAEKWAESARVLLLICEHKLRFTRRENINSLARSNVIVRPAPLGDVTPTDGPWLIRASERQAV